MKSMDHKNLCKLYSFEEDDINFMMLMEYCDGGDLLNVQARQPGSVFSLQEAIKVLKEVIWGLEELHRRGYLHRDIKMQNILIKNENGEKVVKICDFGFAKKNNMRDTVLGTEQFMSPEVYKAGVD